MEKKSIDGDQLACVVKSEYFGIIVQKRLCTFLSKAILSIFPAQKWCLLLFLILCHYVSWNIPSLHNQIYLFTMSYWLNLSTAIMQFYFQRSSSNLRSAKFWVYHQRSDQIWRFFACNINNVSNFINRSIIR